MSKMSHSFGDRAVTPEQRTSLIRRVFSGVAWRYDLMNDVMSMGIHRLWKKRFVAGINLQPGQMIVDLAAGTGDIGIKMARRGARVYLVDPSLEMMRQGQSRVGGENQSVGEKLTFIAAQGEQMPFADNSVDHLTISFGIRNTTYMDSTLREIFRILKPGGQFHCLEFSRPAALIRPFYNWHSRYIIPRLGAWIARQPEAYQYLIESIRRFPDQREMARLIEDQGFAYVTYRNLSFGIACIHTGIKPADA